MDFGDTEIDKHNFYCHKNQILIDDVEIKKIMLSNMVTFVKRILNI